MGHSHSHISAKSIDEYAYSSGLKNINSGLKIIVALSFIVISVCADNLITPLFCVLSCCLVTIFIGKMHFKNYISLFSIPFVFMLMGSVAIAMTINFSGEFFIKFYYKDIIHALIISAKALGSVSAMYMLSLSTPMNEIISVLGKIRLPEILCELMRLMYRYIFILVDSQVKMKNSAASRLGYSGYRRSIKTFGLVCSNLLVVSLHRASDYYNAVESRSCRKNMKFLIQKHPIKVMHTVIFALWISAAIGIEILCRFNT